MSLRMVIVLIIGILLPLSFATGCSFFGGVPPSSSEVSTSTLEAGDIPIMGEGESSPLQLGRVLATNNPRVTLKQAKNFASIYIEEARKENVNWDVAFAQMCLETKFLRFGGQVSPQQKNFSGLGATDDGAAGASFQTIREGIRAHIQHLKAYGSTSPVSMPIVDPRFDLVERGSAPYLKDLTAKWATDPQYDAKIEGLIQRIHSN